MASLTTAIINYGGNSYVALQLNLYNCSTPSVMDNYSTFYESYIAGELSFPYDITELRTFMVQVGLNYSGITATMLTVPYSTGDVSASYQCIKDFTSFPEGGTGSVLASYIVGSSTLQCLNPYFVSYPIVICCYSGADDTSSLISFNIYTNAVNMLYSSYPQLLWASGTPLPKFFLPPSNQNRIFNTDITNTNTKAESVEDAISGGLALNTHDVDTNPYKKGGNSGTAGGTGTFDHTTSNIDFPTVPVISAVSAGMISLYVPSVSQIQALASYMWTPTFYDTIVKLWADPMDAIIGLSILPFSVGTGSSQDVKVGNISTGISMPLASAQYQEINCGSLAIPEYWGAALDYDPYTRIQIYLPYIGIRELNTDDVMNKTVQCKYRIDILSGACCALLKCGTDVLYQFNGQCASNIPLSATNYTGMIQSAISAVGAVALGVASGGASAPISAAMAGGAVNMGAQAANSAINSKPRVQHSGQMGGAGGLLAVQTPYIIVTCPKQSMPKSLNTFEGYPSNINAKLSSLTGYTQIETIRLSGLSCTEDEKNELYSILQKGVIL